MLNISGIFTALITPFTYNDKIDEYSLHQLLEQQMNSPVHGIVACSSTGELACLSPEEYSKIAKITISYASNKIKILNTSAFSTAETIKRTNLAKQYGYDAVLINPPASINLSNQNILEYYKEIHNESDINIIIYNVPSRTSIDITIDDIIQLSRLKRIIAIKDASANLSKQLMIDLKIDKKNFATLSGDDLTYPAHQYFGGEGCISVLSNIYPEKMVQIFNLIKSNKYDQALILHRDLSHLHERIYKFINPVAIKYLACLLEIIRTDYVRSPLKVLSEQEKNYLKANILKS